MKKLIILITLAIVFSLFAAETKTVALPEKTDTPESVEIRLYRGEGAEKPVYTMEAAPAGDSREIEVELPEGLDIPPESIYVEVVSGEEVIIEREPLERPMEPMAYCLTVGNGSDDIFIDGQVGIGTNSPTSALEIVEGGNNVAIEFDRGSDFITIHDGSGNFNILSGLDPDNNIVGTAGGGTRLEMSEGGYFDFEIYDDTPSITNHLYIGQDESYFDGANVGIGTSNPNSLLDVDGIIRADHYYDNAGGNLLNEGSGISIAEQGDGSWTITCDATSIQRIHLKTNVNSAMVQGSANEFDVNFNIEAYNDAAAFSHSGGVVTVASDGVYRIYANMVYENGTSSARNTANAYVKINGSMIVSTQTADYDRGASYGKYSNNKVQTTIQLSAGDQVSIGTYAINEDGTMTITSDRCEFIIERMAIESASNTWRPIDDTPTNGATTTSISSNWAYDLRGSSSASLVHWNKLTGVPSGLNDGDNDNQTLAQVLAEGNSAGSYDINMNANDVDNLNSIDFDNTEEDYHSASRGRLYFDENYYSSGEAGGGNFYDNGGGLAVYNEDGWGALISDENMQYLSMDLHSLHIGGTSNPAAGNLIVDGKIGIGTSPDQQLTIQGGTDQGELFMDSGDEFHIRNDYQNNEILISDGSGGIRFEYDDNEVMRIDGNVGIGTTAPGAELEIHADDSWEDIMLMGYSSTDNKLRFGTGYSWASISGGTSNTDDLVIQHSSGNIGINNTSPSHPLDITGKAYASGNIQSEASLICGSTDASPTSRYSTTPDYSNDLYCAGQMIQNGTGGLECYKIGVGGNPPGNEGEARFYPYTYCDVVIDDESEASVRPDPDWYGYVGTSSHAWYRMYSYSFNDVSLREKKRDIVQVISSDSLVERVVADIERIQPSFYKYKMDSDNPNDIKYRKSPRIGVIVDESPPYILDNEHTAVDIYSLSTLSIAGVKINRSEIKELREENERLEEEVDILREEIEALKNQVSEIQD